MRVYCNVHHAMAASILVLGTPYYTVPDESGAFRLAGVPDGPGRLIVWHERTEGWSREIVAPTANPVDVSLAITRRKVPRHLNKFGRPYRRNPRERYD